MKMSSSSKKRSRSISSISDEKAVNKRQLYDAIPAGKRRVFYPGHFDTRDLRLMEVPADFCDTESIGTGENFKIVGDNDKNDTVLCSLAKTYTIRRVETSNQIYLVTPSNSSDFGIEGGIREYYEIKPIAGRIGRIKELLNGYDHVYEGPEGEHSKDPSVLLTKSQLWAQIQASDNEIQSALNSLGVVEINNKMRLLSPEAVSAVSRDLLDTATINSWDLKHLHESIVTKEMASTDIMLLRHVLSTLGTLGTLDATNDDTDTDTNTNTGTGTIWVLDSDKVARKTAHMLFENKEAANRLSRTMTSGNSNAAPSAHINAWGVTDFLGEWGAFTPGNGKVARELLVGIAVLIKDANTKDEDKKEVYRYAPAEQIRLLSTPSERLKKLFSIKSRFELAELAPYMADLVTGKVGAKSVAELLLANARLVDKIYYMEK